MLAFCYGLLWFVIGHFTYIIHGYFIDTGAIIQFLQYQWSKPVGYGLMAYK